VNQIHISKIAFCDQVSKKSTADLSCPITKLSQSNYSDSEGCKYLIISYISDFCSYTTQNRERNSDDRHDVNAEPSRQMDKLEQRFIVKFFFLKGFGSKEIHRKLTVVLGFIACSSGQINESRARFKATFRAKTDSDLVSSSPFGDESLRFTSEVSFCDGRSYCATFQSV
jgi:hypothetical protein